MGFFHTFPFQRGKGEIFPADLPKAHLPLKKGGREGFPGGPFQSAKVLGKQKDERIGRIFR
jgi:hypothetical protein